MVEMDCNDYILQEFVDGLKSMPEQEQMDMIKNLVLSDKQLMLLLFLAYKMKMTEGSKA